MAPEINRLPVTHESFYDEDQFVEFSLLNTPLTMFEDK